MDDQALMRTYGNTDLAGGTAERPLVTFALFAYNQEKYIREAVEGAFSQTYSPLEIILSDDQSRDRTFGIMEEMAREYKGQHRVITRRGQSNQGLIRHIRAVAEISSGSLIVVAAGDDISLPERSSKLTELMLRERSDVAASNYSKISEEGQVLEENLKNDYSGNYLWQIVNARPGYFANGAAASYRKSFLVDAFKAINETIKCESIYNEDILFAALSVAKGSMPSHFDAAPLIMYRINPKSLSNFESNSATMQGQIELIRREVFRSHSRQACLRAILEAASYYPRLKKRLNFEKIDLDLRLSRVEIGASDQNILFRAKTLLLARNANEFRIILARVFGLKFLAFLRSFAAKLKSTDLKRAQKKE